MDVRVFQQKHLFCITYSVQKYERERQIDRDRETDTETERQTDRGKLDQAVSDSRLMHSLG